jgi:plasmid stabilization system protein ParE
MKYKLVLRPEAVAEVKDAFFWYEERRRGLGHEFLLSLDAAMSFVKRSPKVYPVVYKDIRRAILERFPFGVFYLIENDIVTVLAVFHARRDPKRWKQRK